MKSLNRNTLKMKKYGLWIIYSQKGGLFLSNYSVDKSIEDEEYLLDLSIQYDIPIEDIQHAIHLRGPEASTETLEKELWSMHIY